MELKDELFTGEFAPCESLLFIWVRNIFSCKTLMRNESNTSRSKDCLLFFPDGGLDPEEPCIWPIDPILNNWETYQYWMPLFVKSTWNKNSNFAAVQFFFWYPILLGCPIKLGIISDAGLLLILNHRGKAVITVGHCNWFLLFEPSFLFLLLP